MYTLITGATGGLGSAFAHKCAKQGCNLFLTGRNQQKLQKISSEIKQIYPNCEVFCKTCDFADELSRKELINFLDENNIVVSRLINNAGCILEGSVFAQPTSEVLSAIKINCEATVELTLNIISRNDGHQPLDIITISSMAAYYPMPHMAVYASTKSFLKNYMLALRQEFKKSNIHITTVCPSGIPTSQQMKDAIAAQGIGGRITSLTAEKVAECSLKASRKNKAVIVPKFINKCILMFSKILGDVAISKIIEKKWKRSLQKRALK